MQPGWRHRDAAAAVADRGGGGGGEGGVEEQRRDGRGRKKAVARELLEVNRPTPPRDERKHHVLPPSWTTGSPCR